MGGLIALCAALLVACAYFALHLFQEKRKQRQTTERIETFLQTEGSPLPIATDDGSSAMLQNAISELENRVLLLEEQRRLENHRATALTADISHQLKTPLAALRLYCELDEGAHMDAELGQIERMENLISALLRLERLSADGYEFHFAEADARTIVEEAWDALRGVWRDASLSIVGNARLRCDQGWLGEAIGNLLKNACEHAPEGVRIRVEIEQTDAATFITVADDGGGVPEEALSKLFTRFYRQPGGSGSGSGLGLSIAREIVRRHHGTLTARNAYGGLTMEISIPIWNLAKT